MFVDDASLGVPAEWQDISAACRYINRATNDWNNVVANAIFVNACANFFHATKTLVSEDQMVFTRRHKRLARFQYFSVCAAQA